jgi:hypothetical protein
MGSRNMAIRLLDRTHFVDDDDDDGDKPLSVLASLVILMNDDDDDDDDIDFRLFGPPEGY